MNRKETFRRLLSSKDTWHWAVGVALFLMVWGSTMTPLKGNIALVFAVVAMTAAVFFNHNLADDGIVVRFLWSAVVGGVAGLFAYHVLWDFDEPAAANLQIDYRVTGGEDRGWKIGAKDTYKTILLEMEIVNRSPRKMLLEINMTVPWKTASQLWPDFVSLEGKWSDNTERPRLADGTDGYSFEPDLYPALEVEPESRISRKVVFFLRQFQLDDLDTGPPPKWKDLEIRTLTIRDRISGLTLKDASPLGHPPENARPYISFIYPPEDVPPEFAEKESGIPFGARMNVPNKEHQKANDNE